MRYSAAEKLEIIRLVEHSSLPVRRTLAQIGIPRSTFYAWYERYLARGAGALEDGQPAPRRVWNKLPDTIAQAVVGLALKEPELSPRELAVSFIDQQQYFVSESSVYRLLKTHNLITSPAFILIKAADTFAQPTTAPNQLWQTDFTYLRVIGWGWFYLSTVLDDFSRYILAWKLCTTMAASDVADTLRMALDAAGLERIEPPLCEHVMDQVTVDTAVSILKRMNIYKSEGHSGGDYRIKALRWPLNEPDPPID